MRFSSRTWNGQPRRAWKAASPASFAPARGRPPDPALPGPHGGRGGPSRPRRVLRRRARPPPRFPRAARGAPDPRGDDLVLGSEARLQTGRCRRDMTTQEMARSFLRRAAAILREAERLLGDEAWNLVVRRCQEAVEFALKGALREAGVEVPKVHDVSDALRRNTRRLPAHLAAEIDLLVSASRRLREERELAFYGDEETEAEALFSRED